MPSRRQTASSVDVAGVADVAHPLGGEPSRIVDLDVHLAEHGGRNDRGYLFDVHERPVSRLDVAAAFGDECAAFAAAHFNLATLPRRKRTRGTGCCAARCVVATEAR